MAAVARRAGVSSGLPYRYFGTRSGLFIAVVDAFYHRLGQACALRTYDAPTWEREKQRICDWVASLYAAPLAPVVLSGLVGDGEVAAAHAGLLTPRSARRSARRTGQVPGQVPGTGWARGPWTGENGVVSWIAPQVTRVDEPFVAGERAMLEGFLEWQRATLLHKCAGLSGGQLAERSVPPSTLSLLGLVRHHADVERMWFRRRFRGEDLPRLFWREDWPDAAFDEVGADRAEADFACLRTEWDLARRAASGASLDEIFISDRWGQMSLRWVYLHMIEEYARHAGHADLLRQRIDGTTGS